MITSHFPTVTYPRHALVVPSGVINILMLKNLVKKSHKLQGFSQTPHLRDVFHKDRKKFSFRQIFFNSETFWGVRPFGHEYINISNVFKV